MTLFRLKLRELLQLFATFGFIPQRSAKSLRQFRHSCIRSRAGSIANSFRDSVGCESTKSVIVVGKYRSFGGVSSFGTESRINSRHTRYFYKRAPLRTLDEIKVECRHEFLQLGGEDLDYIPALNDRDAHIEMMRQLVEPYLSVDQQSGSV